MSCHHCMHVSSVSTHMILTSLFSNWRIGKIPHHARSEVPSPCTLFLSAAQVSRKGLRSGLSIPFPAFVDFCALPTSHFRAKVWENGRTCRASSLYERHIGTYLRSASLEYRSLYSVLYFPIYRNPLPSSLSHSPSSRAIGVQYPPRSTPASSILTTPLHSTPPTSLSGPVVPIWSGEPLKNAP